MNGDKKPAADRANGAIDQAASKPKKERPSLEERCEAKSKLVWAPTGIPPAADPEDIQNDPQKYVDMRADEIEAATLKEHEFGMTAAVMVVQKKGQPETRRVIVTDQADKKVARSVQDQLLDHEEAANPGPVLVKSSDPDDKNLYEQIKNDQGETVLKKYDKENDKRHHAEQRAKKWAEDNDYEIVAIAPTRGCCESCQGALGSDLGKVPEKRQSAETFSASRRELKKGQKG